ncbi:MAG: RagB/SusD family nutrient uptake outer membrane protein, partial [Verrucomicrobia bacterium]|nr:RagB/SusD family nutrient uptake outer membrane protein [Verrucomicrobiota bacterium]
VLDGLTSDLAITTTSSSTDPIPIIRNEELILLRAEANIGLGNFGAAEADMNIVRAAAGLAPYSGTDASNGLDRLLHEKRYSLFAEGHRWVDMRRYGKLGELPIDRPDRGDRVIEHMAIPETERSESN